MIYTWYNIFTMAEFKPQSVPDPSAQPKATGGKLDQQIDFDFPEIVQQQNPNNSGGFYSNNKWYIWASVLGLIIIGVLAYFAFHKQTPEPTKHADVSVTIDAPETAPSGGEVIYKIQIDNHDKAKLVGMNLELVYEDGITYVSSTPPSDGDSGNRFPVPDLAPGENVVLIIKTTASGNINEDKQIVARLRYKFDNFSSEFTEESSHKVRLIAADIILDVTGPEKSTNVQTATYDIFYRNDSPKDISGARIQVTYPSEFKYVGSDPSPSLGQNIWNINNLAKNGSGKISFNGTFAGVKTGQSAIFKVEFLALDSNNSFFTQSSTTYMTTVEAQPLSVEQRTTNEISNGVVKPGDTLDFELKFQNNTQVAATGVSIVAQIDSKALDLGTIRADGGLVEGNTITWNAAGERKLEKLNPNDSGTVRYSFQLKNPAVKDGSKNLNVVSKTQIKSNENTSFLPGNTITLKIASPSNIEAGVTSISGPQPLKVGETNTLQVSVALRNASNDYREGTLIGYIPLGVTFDKASVSSSEAAAVKFDTTTGKLTWTVGQLSAHSGSTSPLRTLKFSVKITPSGNQVNQNIVLFKTISFSAKDTFTEQPISLVTQEVNTDALPGSGNGRVQP
jgi:hypothetical protein